MTGPLQTPYTPLCQGVVQGMGAGVTRSGVVEISSRFPSYYFYCKHLRIYLSAWDVVRVVQHQGKYWAVKVTGDAAAAVVTG